MDMRDEETWQDEYEHTGKKCEQIEHEDEWQVQFYRCFADIVNLRVESDKARVLLKYDDANA